MKYGMCTGDTVRATNKTTGEELIGTVTKMMLLPPDGWVDHYSVNLRIECPNGSIENLISGLWDFELVAFAGAVAK